MPLFLRRITTGSRADELIDAYLERQPDTWRSTPAGGVVVEAPREAVEDELTALSDTWSIHVAIEDAPAGA